MPVTIAIIIALITVSNSWQVIYGYLQNKPDHLFTAITHYFADYFLYISHIAQAQNSQSLFIDNLFTNEPLIPTWIYWFNALLGKVHLNPFLTYNVALILLVVGVLILLWHIIKRSITDSTTRYIAFIFTISASNYFDFTTFLQNGTLRLLGDFWFSPTPALNRLGGVPHQILQTILCLSAITLFTRLSESPKKNPLPYISLFIITLLATSANPIQMLLITLTLLAILAIRTYKKSIKLSDIVTASVVCIPALLAALATNFEFSHQPILTAAKAWEDNQRFSLSIPQFMWALGPIGFFIPFGIYASLKKHTRLFFTLVLYSLISLIFFFTPLPTLLGTSPVRWVSPAAYLGLALLAGYGFAWCVMLLGKKIKNPQATIFIAMTAYLILTIPSIITQVTSRTVPLSTDPRLIALNHIPYEIVDGLVQIQNSTDNGVVVCDPTLFYDVVIPIMTGKKSFTGHPIHTLFPDTKEALRQELFSGTMSESTANEFMNNHEIRYIISTPNHRTVLDTYPFLTVLYTNKSLIIYQKKP